MRTRSLMVLFGLIVAAAQGCSTLINGTTQELQINTTPPGAKATVGTQTCTTPCKMTVKRDAPTLQVEKGNYKRTFDLEKDFQFGTALCLNICWAELGVIVDVASGAAWEIKPINLKLDSGAR